MVTYLLECLLFLKFRLRAHVARTADRGRAWFNQLPVDDNFWHRDKEYLLTTTLNNPKKLSGNYYI